MRPPGRVRADLVSLSETILVVSHLVAADLAVANLELDRTFSRLWERALDPAGVTALSAAMNAGRVRAFRQLAAGAASRWSSNEDRLNREFGSASIQVMRRMRAMLEDLLDDVLPEHRAAVEEPTGVETARAPLKVAIYKHV